MYHKLHVCGKPACLHLRLLPLKTAGFLVRTIFRQKFERAFDMITGISRFIVIVDKDCIKACLQRIEFKKHMIIDQAIVNDIVAIIDVMPQSNMTAPIRIQK